MRRVLTLSSIGCLILATALTSSPAGASRAVSARRKPVTASTGRVHYDGPVSPQPAGLFKPRTAGLGCNPSPCDAVTYHGGAIQQHPHVYLIFWGPKWNTDTTGIKSAAEGFINSLAGSTYNAILSQYYDTLDGPGKHYFANDTMLSGSWIDPVAPSGSHLAEVLHAIDVKGWSNTPNTMFMIFPQQGTPYAGFDEYGGFCAFHTRENDDAGASYFEAVMPYEGDATVCRQPGVSGAQATTLWQAHEYAETVTDPELGQGWYSEIADQCEGYIAGTTFAGHTVPYLFDVSTQSCVASHALRPVNTTTAAAVRVLANNTYEWHRTNDNVNTITTPQLFIYGNNNGANPDDIPIAGDWNGNGTDTIGYVRIRVSDGKFEWHLTNTNLSADTITPLPLYGNVNLGDVPVVGDWDGDGDVTIGVARPESGKWVWHLTNNNSTTIAGAPPQYGNASTDQPVVGDWNGDGITDLGAIRLTPPSTQYVWHLANGAQQTIWSITFGNSALGDKPIAGDWDGDGRWTAGVTRPVSGHFEWHLSDESGNTLFIPDGVFNYGNLTTDKPVAANWDGT